MRINSYCGFADAEKVRVTLGSDDGLNWETLGLIHLTVFIMIATLYLTTWQNKCIVEAKKALPWTKLELELS